MTAGGWLADALTRVMARYVTRFEHTPENVAALAKALCLNSEIVAENNYQSRETFLGLADKAWDEAIRLTRELERRENS
jgi:hypothetical protein